MEIKVKKFCVFCKNEILPKEHQFENTELNGGEEISINHYHKNCWDVFTNQLNSASSTLKKSNYLLNILGNQMSKMGMIPQQEEYEIR